MGEYIGLDVSLKDTAVSVRRNGKRVWRGKCASHPQALATLIRKHAPNAERVVFETGPLSVWFFHALSAEGLPAICIEATHTKANRLDGSAIRRLTRTTPMASRIWPRSGSTARSG